MTKLLPVAVNKIFFGWIGRHNCVEWCHYHHHRSGSGCGTISTIAAAIIASAAATIIVVALSWKIKHRFEVATGDADQRTQCRCKNVPTNVQFYDGVLVRVHDSAIETIIVVEVNSTVAWVVAIEAIDDSPIFIRRWRCNKIRRNHAETYLRRLWLAFDLWRSSLLSTTASSSF